MQYLDLLGLQQLWTSAKAKFAIKGTLANSGITDGYSSIETGSITSIKNIENGILADIIPGSDNHKLKTAYVPVDTAGGLASMSYVDTKVGAVKVPAYTLTKSTSTDYAAVYHLQKDGANVGEAINIPKDMVVESGKVVWGSYADGVFTPSTDKKNATPYVELTLANSTANKIYIAVADLVNEHKAGTGISITNNTDGTRTIGLTNAVDTKINQSFIGFAMEDEHTLRANMNNGTTKKVLSTDDNFVIGTSLTADASIKLSSELTTKIDTAKSQSDTNKTDLAALTKRIDGIVATGGEANQNAYSSIKVGNTTLYASSKTDTIELAGSSIITVIGSTSNGK